MSEPSAVLTPAIYARLRDLIHQQAGIALGENKMSLMSARLQRRLRAHGLTSYAAYLDLLGKDEHELPRLLDAISTNVTSFFREADHFSCLLEHVRQRRQAGQDRFRFWSAACSTGQEPLTLSMVLAEETTGCDLRILATDINSTVLHQAQANRYELDHLGQIPQSFRRYCRIGADGFAIDPTLHGQVLYRRLNLSQSPFPMQGPMDAILCRNVLIYFDTDLRGRLFTEFARLLAPGGLLILGHAEGQVMGMHGFRTLQPSVYRREGVVG